MWRGRETGGGTTAARLVLPFNCAIFFISVLFFRFLLSLCFSIPRLLMGKVDESLYLAFLTSMSVGVFHVASSLFSMLTWLNQSLHR